LDKTLKDALKAIEILQAQLEGATAVVQNWQDIADGYRKENKRLKRLSIKTRYLIFGLGILFGLILGFILGILLA
jgi:hypothetical protein